LASGAAPSYALAIRVSILDDRRDDRRARWLDHDPVSRTLLALYFGVFIVEVTGTHSAWELPPAQALALGATHSLAIFGEARYETLFTASFLHVGVVHVAFDALLVWQAGPRVERVLGSGRMASIALVAGALGNLLSAARAWTSYLSQMTAGATGAIAGMLATEATSIAELTEVRLLLEVPLAGLAAEHATPAAIAELVRAVEDAERAPDDDLVQRETDIRFHRAIVEAGGNRVAGALTAWCSAVLQPCLKDLIAPAIVEAVAREQHREIIAAIEQRKPVLAERAMRVHLRYLADLLETVGTPAGR